jgi:hypothetical protein
VKRPRLRISRLLWVLSLLACAAAVALWVRSGRVMDEVAWVDGDNVLRAFVSYQGAFHLIRAENNSMKRPPDWDAYRISGIATWGDLYGDSRLDWDHLGVMKLSSNPPRVAGPAPKPTYPFGPAMHPMGAPTWLLTRPWKAYAIPYWQPVAVLAIPPLGAALLAWRRSRRRRAGLCPKCGYDLRATPERCPECGAAGADLNRAIATRPPATLQPPA